MFTKGTRPGSREAFKHPLESLIIASGQQVLILLSSRRHELLEAILTDLQAPQAIARPPAPPASPRTRVAHGAHRKTSRDAHASGH